MAYWSTLPTELLHLISQYLHTSTDVLRFRSVCATWRAAVSPPPTATRFPVLPNSGISDTSWGLYLFKRNIYSLQSPLTNDDSWIIKLERDNPAQMHHLLNPLARSQFKPLPNNFPKRFDFFNIRVKELGEEYALQYINYRPMANSIGEAGNLYMEKVAVLNNLGDFVLLTIHVSGKLVVHKSGYEKWKVIDDLPSPYDDVILWRGRFYAVDNTGRIVLVNHVDLNVSVVASSVFGGDKKFLVDSDGQLLLVDMYLSLGPADDLGYNEGFEFYEEFDCYMSERTVKFKVFKLDENARKWVEKNDIGDKMLFLGDNCTFSASAADIFCDDRCKGNCIFFTDQYCDREDDGAWKSWGIGVFDLESGSIGPIASYDGYSKMFWPPPDWVYSTASIEAGLSQMNI